MGAPVLKNVKTFKIVYSNKTFDYTVCKKPISMAIDGVPRGLVEEANAETFVKPESPNDFAEKIRCYLCSPQLIKRQGEADYSFAKEHFDRKILANKYVGYLRDAINV